MGRRNILDEPLMVNGLHAWDKKVTKKKIMIFKLNFSKAFDYSIGLVRLGLGHGTNELWCQMERIN